MKKILLVEDEKILMEMYKEKLEDAGFKVITAFEAREGLKIAKKERPDLIILDILLPRENGVFFLTESKKYPEIVNIPVVVFSNFDDPETKKEAIRLGAKEYLIKTNYTPQEIIKRVRDYLK